MQALHAALASKPRAKKITKQDLWEVDSEVRLSFSFLLLHDLLHLVTFVTRCRDLSTGSVLLFMIFFIFFAGCRGCPWPMLALVLAVPQGEEVPLCTRCSLPVGEFSYQGREGRQTCVHTECMAQILSQDRQVAEDNRARREDLKKQKNRQEYDIGWRMDSVPKNVRLAERMGCSPAPQGLCCLVLDEASRTVKVAATLEPSAAINLEYLLLALKVRRTAKREPLFSLDPVDPHNLEKTPQKKVYEPSWLAGTSVGDVMFQADYFLKELALGEYSMPVSDSAAIAYGRRMAVIASYIIL